MTPEPSGALEACFCATDLLSAMQGLLAAVTESEAADEAERERIEEGVIPDPLKCDSWAGVVFGGWV
jgi:hypothetical protein